MFLLVLTALLSNALARPFQLTALSFENGIPASELISKAVRIGAKLDCKSSPVLHFTSVSAVPELYTMELSAERDRVIKNTMDGRTVAISYQTFINQAVDMKIEKCKVTPEVCGVRVMDELKVTLGRKAGIQSMTAAAFDLDLKSKIEGEFLLSLRNPETKFFNKVLILCRLIFAVFLNEMSV